MREYYVSVSKSKDVGREIPRSRIGDQSEQISPLEEGRFRNEREILKKDFLKIERGRLEIMRLFLTKRIRVTIPNKRGYPKATLTKRIFGSSSSKLCEKSLKKK